MWRNGKLWMFLIMLLMRKTMQIVEIQWKRMISFPLCPQVYQLVRHSFRNCGESIKTNLFTGPSTPSTPTKPLLSQRLLQQALDQKKSASHASQPGGNASSATAKLKEKSRLHKLLSKPILTRVVSFSLFILRQYSFDLNRNPRIILVILITHLTKRWINTLRHLLIQTKVMTVSLVFACRTLH